MSALEVQLAALVGARVDGVFANPETGLVVVSMYAGERRLLGVGVGPVVAAVGLLPRAPRARAPSTHPLVAALRAHILDHRLRSSTRDDEGTLWLAVGGEGAVARLALHPGRRGYARIVDAAGRTVLVWPPRADAPAADAPGGTSPAGVIPEAPPEDPFAAGAALLEASERHTFERAHARILRAASRRVAVLARRGDAVRADLARLDEIGKLQKIGRLLLAQGPRVPRGASRATLEDWEDGGTLEVPLDPARPAKAQSETFFARARRYQRGAALMTRRLEETARALGAVEELARDLRAHPAREPLPAPLAERARALGVNESDGGPGGGVGVGRGSPRGGSRRPFVRYKSERGHTILVGRGGRDNDALTTQHARPHDLWLHAKDLAGAHVVVALEKGQSCPPDVLVDAATLAAYHSSARDEGVCEVSYVERRYVRKPRGSAPGAVTYDHEKVLVLRVEPERVARLLASREE